MVLGYRTAELDGRDRIPENPELYGIEVITVTPEGVTAGVVSAIDERVLPVELFSIDELDPGLAVTPPIFDEVWPDVIDGPKELPE